MAWRADRDPEQARQQLGPVLECMMDVVHRYEGTTNQVLRDGMMVWFGVSIVHQDHAVRACYATLAMQTAVKQYAAEVQRTHGVPIPRHMGLKAGAEEALGRKLAHLQPVGLEEAHALTEVLGLRPLQAHCHLGLGILYAKVGQQETARTELSAGIELDHAMDMTFWLPQAEAALAQVEER
jgi:Flp pilus assembly protein TadD